MHGFPSAPGQQVDLSNWRSAPWNRWAFQHVREIVPSADIANDPQRVTPLPDTLHDLSPVRFALAGGEQISLQAFLPQAHVDGLLVLQDGAIVFEHYRNEMHEYSPHILMSVSKSVLGMLAGILAHKSIIDVETPVTDTLPELQTTAYKGATIRNLLDMQVGVRFDENYLATDGPIIAYRKATNWNPLAPGEAASDLRSFYQLLDQPDGQHGGRFHYVSPNTDLLAWVLERASGRRYADLLSEHLWQPLGAQSPAYITVDRLGAPRAAGGVCTTLRDLARLAQLLVDDGYCHGQALLPPGWVDDLQTAGDRSAWQRGDFAAEFPGRDLSYRNQWYALHADTDWLMAVGIHGQNIYVNRRKQFAMVKFSSSPAAIDGATMIDGLSAAIAIADFLGES